MLIALGTGMFGASALPAAACSAKHSARTHAVSCPASRFVTVCGRQLCLDGKRFLIHGATAYGTYDAPADEVALAKSAGLDVLELVEFDTAYHALGDVESEATWRRVDDFVAAAGSAGMHVVLNLSEYGQSLLAAGITPTTTDWGGYLDFIAGRRNTVTGVRYGEDPTIAMVELYGEIDPPHAGPRPGAAGRTGQITAFFHRTLREWHSLAPHILASTGGFSYVGYPNSGIDWQRIVKDRLDATCDIEVNSENDRQMGVPPLSSLCGRLAKPWFLAAWSACYGDPGMGYNYYPSDAAMAHHVSAMYELAGGAAPAAGAAAGTDFWNLSEGPASIGSCSIGRSFPLSLAAVSVGLP